MQRSLRRWSLSGGGLYGCWLSVSGNQGELPARLQMILSSRNFAVFAQVLMPNSEIDLMFKDILVWVMVCLNSLKVTSFW